MFESYAFLHLRHKLPVYPIVLYLKPGTGGMHQETYEEQLFEDIILQFKYRAIGLPDLFAEDYLENENPLAPALSAWMRFSRRDKVRHKLLSLKRVAVSKLDDLSVRLLIVNT